MSAEPPAQRGVTLAKHTGMLRPQGWPLCCGERGCDMRLRLCAAVPPMAPGCRWSRELWNDTNLPEPHTLESLCNYTGRNGYKEHLT